MYANLRWYKDVFLTGNQNFCQLRIWKLIFRQCIVASYCFSFRHVLFCIPNCKIRVSEQYLKKKVHHVSTKIVCSHARAINNNFTFLIRPFFQQLTVCDSRNALVMVAGGVCFTCVGRIEQLFLLLKSSLAVNGRTTPSKTFSVKHYLAFPSERVVLWL